MIAFDGEFGASDGNTMMSNLLLSSFLVGVGNMGRALLWVFTPACAFAPSSHTIDLEKISRLFLVENALKLGMKELFEQLLCTPG
jgi:hypothetical protein